MRTRSESPQKVSSATMLAMPRVSFSPVFPPPAPALVPTIVCHLLPYCSYYFSDVLKFLKTQRMKERSSIGSGDDSGRRGRPLFVDAAAGLPRPGTKYSSLVHSDPLMKSTSEEDFVSISRHSSASAGTSPGGYLSDHTTSSAGSSNTHSSPASAASSPFSSSPWHQSTNTVNTADLFPSGTGLVGSLVREEGHIYSLAAGASGLLYTGSDSKNIRVWRERREFSGFKSSSGLVKAIVLSSNGLRVYSGHQDGKIRVWAPSPKDPTTHKRISTLPRLKDLLKASFHPSAARRRRRGGGAVRIRHTDAVSCLCLSEDESLLYSGSWDRTIKAWRIADSQCVDSIEAHDDAVNAVVAAFKGLVFSGSADGTVKVWRRETTVSAKKEGVAGHAAEKTLMKQDSAVTALSINVGAGVVYAGSSDGIVNCWDWGRRLEHCGALRGHGAAVLCLAAAGGSSLVFSGSADKTICVWQRDEESGTHSCLSVLTAHTGPVKCLAVQADHSADGKEEGEEGGGVRRRWVLYSGSLDKSVKVWNVVEPAAGQAAEPLFDTY